MPPHRTPTPGACQAPTPARAAVAALLAALAALGAGAAPAAAADLRLGAPMCRLEGREVLCAAQQSLTFDRIERLAPVRQGLGLILQGGKLSQRGDRLSGAIVQTGPGNVALVRQIGRDHRGAVVQSGEDNAAALVQIGAAQSGVLQQTGVGARAIVVQSGVRIRP